MTRVGQIATWLSLLALGSLLPAAAWSADFRRVADIPFAIADGHELRLDLYLPSGVDRPPLIVYVHGGAWRADSKESMPLAGLVSHGFAVASVDYRLSPVAQFPAQIHDIKAAIRFLRATQSDYGYDASRITISGASAGGHLAGLVGVTNGNKELEGDLGNHRNESSDVQAIVDYYGASNLLTILNQSTPHGIGVRVPALQLLLGAQPEDSPELAKLASPLFQVDPSDPPLLLLHGDQDPQMPINQSHELYGAYKKAGLPVRFEVLHGAAHGGSRFYDDHSTGIVVGFLNEFVRSGSSGR
jgi:acetyl esterase/lipase